MSEVRRDIFGNIPKVGDIIIFNPLRYKGLVYAECIGLTSCGGPKVIGDMLTSWPMSTHIKFDGFYSVKTNFAIK